MNQPIPKSFTFTKVQIVTTPVEHHETYTTDTLRFAAVSGIVTNKVYGLFQDRVDAALFAEKYLVNGYVVDLQSGERVNG